MTIACKGKYWIKVVNESNHKSLLTSYDGYNTLIEANKHFDDWCDMLSKATSANCVVSIIDKNNNIKIFKKVGSKND